MSFRFVSTVVVSLGLASCVNRQFNSAAKTKNFESDSTTSASEKVDARAFNAYAVWSGSRGGKLVEPIFAPPSDYEVLREGKPDGLFSVSYGNSLPCSNPTEGAKVADDLLEYPTLNGRQLKLKFSAKSLVRKNQLEAMKDCLSKGLRLPSVRELFDFCVVGTPVTKIDLDPQKFYKQSRCLGDTTAGLWTFEVSEARSYGWYFDPEEGLLNVHARLGDSATVSPDADYAPIDLDFRCVGNE